MKPCFVSSTPSGELWEVDLPWFGEWLPLVLVQYEFDPGRQSMNTFKVSLDPTETTFKVSLETGHPVNLDIETLTELEQAVSYRASITYYDHRRDDYGE